MIPAMLTRNVRCMIRLSKVDFSTTIASSTTPEFLSDLSQALPQVEVSTNPYDCETHGHGESYHRTQDPAAVLTPSSREDVQEIIKLCSQHLVPVIPYGAGTSVEGHVCAKQSGTISLDMTKFDSIELFDSSDSGLPDAHAAVGAGVHRRQLNEALRHTGLQFVVDPGADATIGGMVACGASGTTAVKYGTMRENILGVECVLPNGEVANCGTRALKSSAGYDLTSLMTGSEGTLGVITKVIVKLHPIPSHVTAAVCVFDELSNAAQAVAALKLCGIPLSRCELLDDISVAAFNQYLSTGNGVGKSMKVKPTLFLEFEGASEAEVQEHVSMTEAIVQDFEGSHFDFTSAEAERKKLWSARHNLYYATLALGPGSSSALLTDACVPLSSFADLIVATADDVKRLDVVGPCFGHAGDGNFHCILPLVEGDSEEYLSRVHEVNDNLIRRTLQAGGTCTGEHGIGYGKIKYLELQYGSASVDAMRMIKKAFDPLNIMNPGKVVPW